MHSSCSLVSFHFLHKPLLEEPPTAPLPDPISHPEWYGELWLRYPGSSTPTSAYFGTLFKAKCDFRVILNDLCLKLFPGAPDHRGLTMKEAVAFRRRFGQWESRLPSALSATRIVFPAQLVLQ
jgi:hypothetical protein